ncbi:MAG: hypothetical protein MUD08_00530, partial [Cytophagales bacterium]|nr:hypothetical protein [Cytophagales bacterium]
MRYLNLFRIIKVIPRWTVLQIDLLLCAFALALAFLFRFNLEWSLIRGSDFLWALALVLPIKALFFLLTQSYAGIIRYTSVEDAKRIFLAVTYATGLILGLNSAYRFFQPQHQFLVPVSILLIDYFFSMLFMGAFRILVKIIYFEWKNQQSEKMNVVIYGAGEAGVITKKTITQDRDTHLHVVGFLDDDPAKVRNTIDGVPIYHNTYENLKRLVNNR